MSAKIKGMTGQVARRRPGRPAGKGETGAIYADVDQAYARLCRKYGWPLPGKWKARKAINYG